MFNVPQQNAGQQNYFKILFVTMAKKTFIKIGLLDY